MSLSSAFAKIFRGWFGDLYPPREPPPAPAFDAREHALGALADYFSEVVFTAPKAQKAPTFKVPRRQIHTHQPPDPELLKFPSMAFIPQRGRHDQFRIGPPPDDPASFNVYAPGTVLLQLGEYTELLPIEVWGSNDAERTSLVAGIEGVLRQGEWSSGLLLTLPEYFGRIARFTLEEGEHLDEPDVVRNRIKARVWIRLEVPEVLLVNAVTMRPYLRNSIP